MTPAIYFWQAKAFRHYAEQTDRSLSLCAMDFIHLKLWNKVKDYATEHPTFDISAIVGNAMQRYPTEQAKKNGADYIAARALRCLHERYHWIAAPVMRTKFFSSQTYAALFDINTGGWYDGSSNIVKQFEHEVHLRHSL